MNQLTVLEFSQKQDLDWALDELENLALKNFKNEDRGQRGLDIHQARQRIESKFSAIIKKVADEAYEEGYSDCESEYE